MTAVVFALAHLGLLTTGATSGTVAFLVSGVLGLLAGYVRWLAGSLIPCFILHARFNISGTAADWRGRSSAL